MSAELFIVPVASASAWKNFLHTVVTDVPRHYWGLRTSPSNLRKWERASVGDFIVFKNAFHYLASAQIKGKSHDPGLAETLWGKDSRGHIWQHVFQLSPPTRLNLPVAEYEAVLGIREGGFDRVSPERLAKALSLYGQDRFLSHFGVDTSWGNRFGT